MWRFLEITIERLAQCRCLDRHIKEPYEMTMAWEPDVGPNSSVRMHIYARKTVLHTISVYSILIYNAF